MNPALDPLESPECRSANTVLKNADISPIKIALHRELTEVRREFSRARDPAERERLARETRWLPLASQRLDEKHPVSELRELKGRGAAREGLRERLEPSRRITHRRIPVGKMRRAEPI